MGTPEFALPSLRALIEKEKVVAVVTQPDRPKGRGKVLTPPPVKELAVAHGIPVLQPHSLRDGKTVAEIGSYRPDLIVVVSYGKILPKTILEIPPYGCINVHASLLPKYRGAAPINWALINGEEETGVTIMQMDEGMDTGDILLQRAIPIEEDDDVETLSRRLSLLGAELLVEAIDLLKEGRLSPVPQDGAKATYAPLLKKEDGLIPWTWDAWKIKDFVRGMNPWPGAYTFWKGKRLKILKGVPLNDGEGEPGEVIRVSREGIDVATGKGVFRVQRLQPEGKKEMKASEFIQGYRIHEGERFGREGSHQDREGV